MGKSRSAIILPLVCALLFGAALVSTFPERVRALKDSYEFYAPPPLAGVNPKFVNIMLLGLKPIYDDFISVWLLQSLLDKTPNKDPEKLLAQIRSVIRHEPKLETTYMLSCFVMANDLKKPEYCQEFSLAGLRAFPESWRIPMTQSYIEWNLLNHPAQAASFLMMAASRKQSPPYVRNAAKKLLETKQLEPDDIAKSMALIAEQDGNEQFLALLKSIEEKKKSDAKAP